METRRKIILQALLALLCLLPHPAFATGSEGPRAAEFILTALATMSPGLLLALALTRGGVKQRLLSLLVPLIVGIAGSPLFYLLTYLGGWKGIAVSAGVPLAAAWFASRPRALKAYPPAEPGKKKITIFHVYLVLATPLVLFFLWKEAQFQYAQFRMHSAPATPLREWSPKMNKD